MIKILLFIFLFARCIPTYYGYNSNYFSSSKSNQNTQQNLQNSFTTEQKLESRTRSLSGELATNGNNDTTATVLLLMKIYLLDGFAIRRIKMFNDRVYLARYRRSYWFGTRYYAIDNRYFLETRETCVYRMNETERLNLEYEENTEPILDIVYQCQRYVQYCCGLDCCQHVQR